MTAVRIHLLRHGEAASSWETHPDPALSATGHQQARDAARKLAKAGPLPVITSPLRRARETAAELEALWECRARIDARISEIPSPGIPLAERADWIRSLAQHRWEGLGEPLHAWRRGIIECLCERTEESVLVCHFMVINTVLGWLQEDGRVLLCAPAHASCTTVLVEGAPGPQQV
jgi:broad specificity phosphatase PhoE